MLEKALTSVSEMESAYHTWRNCPLTARKEVISRIREKLLTHAEQYARAITTDMNKPLAQALAEVKKCATLCDYYLTHINDFLRPQPLQSSWTESYVRLDPLGVLLAVMPWNFPFWQVFRVAIPNLLLGNVLVVKHASNVPTAAALLEEIFLDESLGFPIYKNLPLPSQHVEAIIAHPAIKGVTLTGSEPAGRSVAQCAGKYLKKSPRNSAGKKRLSVKNF
ncbi:MAG: aldehyde dehydrogenase family protein [Capnocytophaga granulosa]